MKNKDSINLNAIICVEVIEKKPSWQYKWQNPEPAIKGFWGVKRKERKEGWINASSYQPNDMVSVDSILADGRYLVDEFEKKIYDKPRVKVIMRGGKYTMETYKYFNTDEEAHSFAEEITAKLPTVTIENDF